MWSELRQRIGLGMRPRARVAVKLTLKM
jgi:hypothetical protein